MTASSDPLFAAFVAMLIDTLALMVPDCDADSDTRAKRRDIARLMFEAFQPCDAIEAMAAARAVAAHHAAMDSFVRGAQPGVSDEKAVRLRANGVAAGRSFDTALRNLRTRRKAQPDAEKVQIVGRQAPSRVEPRMALPTPRQKPPATAERLDYLASTALTTTQRLEAFVTLAAERGRSALGQAIRTG